MSRREPNVEDQTRLFAVVWFRLVKFLSIWSAISRRLQRLSELHETDAFSASLTAGELTAVGTGFDTIPDPKKGPLMRWIEEATAVETR